MISEAAILARALGLEVHAGHGLTYENVGHIAAIPEIVELNIGHFLMGEAMFVGLAEAIREMRKRMDGARQVSADGYQVSDKDSDTLFSATRHPTPDTI